MWVLACSINNRKVLGCGLRPCTPAKKRCRCRSLSLFVIVVVVLVASAGLTLLLLRCCHSWGLVPLLGSYAGRRGPVGTDSRVTCVSPCAASGNFCRWVFSSWSTSFFFFFLTLRAVVLPRWSYASTLNSCSLPPNLPSS